MTFKVGDRIRRVSGWNATTPIGYEGIIREVLHGPRDDLEYRFDGGAWGYATTEGVERWELVAPLGPIRTETVTVRRLEPGVYGRLKVSEGSTRSRIAVGVVGPSLDDSVSCWSLNAPELRELARVALEIAEYLDGVD